MQLWKCVAALLSKGRDRVLSAKLAAQREIEQAAKEREREELAEQIAAEEEKVNELGAWVRDWKDALATREFISELEKVWEQAGLDLSPETERGQRIIWMKQQADRLDPLLPSPPSILDRKNDLERWD
jgi:hypothetical protein